MYVNLQYCTTIKDKNINLVTTSTSNQILADFDYIICDCYRNIQNFNLNTTTKSNKKFYIHILYKIYIYIYFII